ncbi:MAG: peptidoglycan editing factor PgeF [Desulfopila sp.]
MSAVLQEKIVPLFKNRLTGVVAGSVARTGGISPPPYDGTNISFGVGDAESNVEYNRKRIKKLLGLHSLVSAHQVHGDAVHRVTVPVERDYIVDEHDALITDGVGVGLMIGHADCQAVMLYDPVCRVVAAVHSGWRGSVANIVAKTVAQMQAVFGTRAAQLVAAIGPSLGPCCSEFVNYEHELPTTFLPFRTDDNHFDFWQITRHQLLQCGVDEAGIHCVRVCTVCSPDFFSYRRACRSGNGVTGRNASIIALV